jgi:carbonic anhydrase
MIDKFLEGNKRFREEDFAKDRGTTVLWRRASTGGPLDRVFGLKSKPERITGAKAGEIFVQRNIGNIVPVHDWNFATVLEYAVNISG